MFRRKQSVEAASESTDDAAPETSEPVTLDLRSDGPFDIDEIDDEVQRVDLGSLLITPEPDREVRIQVDEATQQVASVLIAGPDGALELRAFAAPRHGDLWSEARRSFAAETAQRGGTATEREGRFGPELVVDLAVQMPDGKTARQPQRVVGVNGPRWLLRGTFVGPAADQPTVQAAWDDTFAQVVVRRGGQAMPPGDALPLSLPPGARRTDG